MTHEFKEIIEAYHVAKQQGIPAVMATVVDVEGSSYRRPGVGMLLLQNGQTRGAVSGGCVEKEVFRQSISVFKTGKPKIMTYDGKYRLGCEGLLYILIEPFSINTTTINTIDTYLKKRKPFEIISFYNKIENHNEGLGSYIKFDKETFTFSKNVLSDGQSKQFQRELLPCFRLIIIGEEHDASKLSELANATGWQVEVVCSSKSNKQIDDFRGAENIIYQAPEELHVENIDDQTAIILMTHNFAKDLLYLQALKDTSPTYIGLLGPARRREKLLSAFIEYFPDVQDDFLDKIHGPAGLNLGAETPQEIAISIIAEILSVIRNQDPISLSNKKGAIHDNRINKGINIDALNT